MKKKFCAASLVPTLLVASSVIFASSDGSGMQLSDVNDSLKNIIQESKDSQVRPQPGQPIGGTHGGQPGNNGGTHGGQPGNNGGTHGGQPGNNGGNNGGNHGGNNGGGTVVQPNQPVVHVDTTRARNEGMRDGSEKGEREGRREGYADGIDSGEREGRRRGTDEGDSAGRSSGIRDGYNVDMAAGAQRGNADGQNAGINNGTAAGKKRCYDAGYTSGYNSTYGPAKLAGQQDEASYRAGFERGRADAASIEVQNGEKAGYQAGFSQREVELERSFSDARSMRTGASKSALELGEKRDLPIELARNGYTTPEERRAYEEGFRDGYNRGYRHSYDDAKRVGYSERYTVTYRRAYDVQYSISYRNGFAEGKERGYQEAYNSAYNSAYNDYYDEYNSREYAGERAQGLNVGQAAGNKEGFAAGSAEQSKRGYKAGYEQAAAEVYPAAFNAGKQAGIAAADRYYSENAVLKVFNISFYDENNNGSFEAGENIILRAEVKNFGFQSSDAVAVAVKSERGEVLFVPSLNAAPVAGRGKTVVNLNIGRLSDIVAPGADALYVTFSEKGKLVGDLRQPYSRVNNNKVGVAAKDNVKVRAKATWFFPKKIGTLKLGEKVIITGKDGSWFKVKRSEVGSGSWTEGFIKSKRLSVQ